MFSWKGFGSFLRMTKTKIFSVNIQKSETKMCDANWFRINSILISILRFVLIRNRFFVAFRSPIGKRSDIWINKHIYQQTQQTSFFTLRCEYTTTTAAESCLFRANAHSSTLNEKGHFTVRFIHKHVAPIFTCRRFLISNATQRCHKQQL